MIRPAPADTSPYPYALTDPHATAIASMKRLPDGTTVCVRRKVVISMFNLKYYIEEPDRSAGIRFDPNNHFPPSKSEKFNLVSFTGTLQTVDGERVIRTDTDYEWDTEAFATLDSVGTNSMTLLGSPVDPNNPGGSRVAGLGPYGLYTCVWGKVTAKGETDDEGDWFVYLDDGWHKSDGTNPNWTGIRVYSHRIPGDNEIYLAAVGACGKKLHDPTPLGPTGDEFVVPVIRAMYEWDLFVPNTSSSTRTLGQITGRVRLVGQSAPGKDVRIYSQYGSVICHGVTSDWTPFTLSGIPTTGTGVAASSPGYLSDTVVASAGDNNVELVLTPSVTAICMGVDKTSIKVCSQEVATIRVLLHDCEGKSLVSRQVKLTTTRGSFTENQSKELIATTDATGFVIAHLTANPDAQGIATVTASDYPQNSCSTSKTITLNGPEVELTANPQFLASAGTSQLTARVTDDGQAIPQANVTFRTDFGTFQQSGTQIYSTQTDINGYAYATLSLTQPGTANLLVVHTDSCSNETISWTVAAVKSNPWNTYSVGYSSPLIVDLDGASDQKKEVVVEGSNGNLTAFSASGSTLWSVNVSSDSGANTPSSISMDSDRSGRPCVVIPSDDRTKVYVFSHEGHKVAGWPAGSHYRFSKVSAAVGDANLDGTPEIVAGDYSCFVFCWNPTGDWKNNSGPNSSFLWRNLTDSSVASIVGSSCALGDIDSDANAIPDVAVGTTSPPEAFAFPGDAWGDFVSQPLYLSGWPKSIYGGCESAPAIGDIDGDGKNDVVMITYGGKLYYYRSTTETWTQQSVNASFASSPALADLDGDGKLDVIFGCSGGKIRAMNWKHEDLVGWEEGIQLDPLSTSEIVSSPVVGDVYGDSEVEVVIACANGVTYAIHKDGLNHRVGGSRVGPIAWARCCIPPSETSSTIVNAPALEDLDHDGNVDVIVAGNKGIYVFPTNVTYAPGTQYPWPTYHHDTGRTGCATAPPAPINASIQGIITKNNVPISGAKVYIYFNDGGTVYQPKVSPPTPRSYVLSVGSDDPNEVCKGAYCISQLEANKVYKLKVEAPGEPNYWVNNISVGTGLTRVDISLP